MIRYAIVRGARDANEVASFLPDNYSVVPHSRDHHFSPEHADTCEVCDGREVLITGRDVYGWTLDDYVRPRLASGNMACEEIAAKARR